MCGLCVAVQSGYSVFSKRLEVVLDASDDDSYGFTVRGGAATHDPALTRPLTVTQIRPGGAAHRSAARRGWLTGSAKVDVLL